MGLKLITIGLLFLFNPNLNIIDIFPDVIGIFLVSLGMAKLSRVNEDMNYSYGMFIKLCGLEFLKLLALGLISNNDITWYLLLSFTFGVIECLLFILAVNHFFNGFENLAVKYDSEFILSTYTTGKKVKKDKIDRVKNTFIGFYIVRNAAATLPEFTQLIKEDLYVNYNAFRPLLYILGVTATLIYSVFFIYRLLSFMKGVRRDKPFMEKLTAEHDRFLQTNARYFISRRMRTVFIMLSLAVILTANPTSDGLSVIPQVVTAVFVAISAVLLAKESRKVLISLIPTGIFGGLSVWTAILKNNYYNETLNVKFEDIFYPGFESARSKFMFVSNINLIIFALEIVAFAILFSYLYKAIRSHIPSAAEESSFTEERKYIIISENEEKIAKMFKLSNILMYIALGLNLAINKLAIFLGDFSAFVPEGYFDIAGTVYSWIVVISVGMVVLWFVRARMIISFAKNEIYPVTYTWVLGNENK